MLKRKIAILLSSLTMFSFLSIDTNVYATGNVNEQKVSYNSEKYEFHETPAETINKMKTNFKENTLNNNKKDSNSERALTSLMAKALDTLGFDNTASALDYSMLAMREEPRMYFSDSKMVNDIWSYSPDFRDAVTNFLWEARSKGAYEYFKTTSINFTLPSNKVEILTNTALKRQTDLFGTLHAVKLNLGIVKSGINHWDMLVLIEDRFDFEKEKYDTFVDLANNIAYYEQELGKVKPYDILIYGDRGNLSSPPFGVPAW